MVLAKGFIILLLLPIVAATHVNEADIRWACGGGGSGQTGHPDNCGINAVNDPVFGDAWIDDDDRVMGVVLGAQARAYPVKMLNSHEIVNDVIVQTPIAVTFCPLCGSGVTFLRDDRTFVASGFLYQHDMVMFDPQSGSLWNQITGTKIGALVDNRVVIQHDNETLQVVPTSITTWGAWKADHPSTQMLQPVHEDYREHAYGTYEENCNLGIGGSKDCSIDNIHPKEQMIDLQVDGVHRAFPLFGLIAAGHIVDDVGGESVLISARFGGEVHAFLVREYQFTFDAGLARDQFGGVWDIQSGTQFDGNGQLEEIPATPMFWFAWHEHYPDGTLWWPDDDTSAKEPQAVTPVFWMLVPIAVALVLYRRQN